MQYSMNAAVIEKSFWVFLRSAIGNSHRLIIIKSMGVPHNESAYTCTLFHWMKQPFMNHMGIWDSHPQPPKNICTKETLSFIPAYVICY